jgi:hypothetical protein
VVGLLLLGAGVDTCRGGKKETGCTALTSGHEHVRVDQDGKHAKALVQLDKSHSTHVRGHVVDPVAAVNRTKTSGFLLEVDRQVFSSGKPLIPLRLGLLVNRADVMTFLQQFADQMSPNEPAGSGYQNAAIRELERQLKSRSWNWFASYLDKEG